MCECVCVCARVCVCAYVYVCLSAPRALITSGMIWCDTGRVRLVKSILQLFRILPSIDWMGVAIVRQYVVHTRQRC